MSGFYGSAAPRAIATCSIATAAGLTFGFGALNVVTVAHLGAGSWRVDLNPAVFQANLTYVSSIVTTLESLPVVLTTYQSGANANAVPGIPWSIDVLSFDAAGVATDNVWNLIAIGIP